MLADTLERISEGAAPHARPAPPPGASRAAAAPAAPAPTALPPPWSGLARPARLRPVVLLLEDDDDARAIYRDMLDFAGYDVMAASDGEEGLRYAETRTPDVVVTDLHMPGMNGVEVARTLREEAPSCPAIIAVTADSLGIEAGRGVVGERPLFDEVLVKPVSPGELVRTIRAYVAPAEPDQG
jgi:CheY-like chemotaxis protein